MDTIADIKKRQLWLEVRCRRCTRSTLFPSRNIPKRLPGDLPVPMAAAFFRCSGCCGKRITCRVANPPKEAGRFQAYKKGQKDR